MAERKINPLWTACDRILRTADLIDRRINKVCKRYYDNKDKPEFKDLIDTLTPQIEEYRRHAYGDTLNYHQDISDAEYDTYEKEIEKVMIALDQHLPFPEDVNNSVLKDFYERSTTMDVTLNVCLPE